MEEELIKLLNRMKYSTFKRDNIDMTKKYIIYLLSKNKSINPKDVMEKISIKPQALANLLTNLENQGYIYRKINKNDKRKMDITITQKGVELKETCYKEEIKKMKDLIEFLGEEDSKKLIYLLERVSNFYEKNRN